MKQAVLLIDCYLYGTIAILAVVLLVLVYLHGQANHLPNPFARKNIVYRPAPKARGVLLGKKYGLLAYSPEPDEGHIIVMGPSGTGKTSALLIPTLRSWQGTALVVDISGDISANVGMPNKIIFDPTAKDCVPYDVFASIDAAPDESERQERLEQLAYLLLPDKANDSEAGIFFAKNGRKMITAALICYYGMGWGFVEICEYFLGHDWRSLLNDIAQQKNKIANMYIRQICFAHGKVELPHSDHLPESKHPPPKRLLRKTFAGRKVVACLKSIACLCRCNNGFLPLPPSYRCGVSAATKPLFSHKGQRNLAPVAPLPG